MVEQGAPNRRRKFAASRKRDRPLGRNIGMLSEYAGMRHGRQRPTWN